MRLYHWAALLAAGSLTICAAPAPRHLLRTDGALTESSARPPREIGESFTAARMAAAGLPPAAGLYLAQEYRTEFNGVTHLVYRQRFQGIDVHGMEWRVNIDSEGRVLNAGGELFAAPTGQPPAGEGLASAARAAVAALDPIRAREFNVRRAGMSRKGDARFVTEDLGEVTGRPVWYPIRGVLHPAWNFLVVDPDGVSVNDVILEPGTETLLARRPMTMFQSAPRGAVFTGISPQPPVKYGVQSFDEPPYVQRVVVPFTSTPASPRGWVSGTETAGNNTVTGHNPAGTTFITNPITAKSATGDFQFPLTLGPGAPGTSTFTDAVTTNLFYWVNRAHDLFYDIGFDEAAGNYQAQNLSGTGLGGDPMYAYSQFGSQALSGNAALNNAFFSTRDTSDGGQGMIAMYLTSDRGVWADGSLAADVIVHEYAHGVTFRLIPTMNFGYQGASMNEALSDFWAAEFITPTGAPPDGVYPIGEYWIRAWGQGIRARPLSTNFEINPLTYSELGRAVYLTGFHEDGQIWAAALWDVRANLIRQFGEAEGRRRLRRIVIDGMKLSPPAPSMVDLRDAVLLAERTDYKGESQSQLWEAFAKRGLGVLAFSPNSDSVQVAASNDKPSNTGIIGVQNEKPYVGEPVRITVFDGNYSGATMSVDITASSGDVETIVLDRDGSTYIGTLPTTGAATRQRSGALSIIAGDAITIYYNDANTGAGAKLIEKTIPVSLNYTAAFSTTAVPFSFPNETALNLRSANATAGARIALPFDFPFFGKKYRELRAFAGGYVQFDTTLTEVCVDEYSLGNYPAIAPLAMWMRTNGSAQPGENVYVSRGPNSFTIRWAGETAPLVNAPPFTAPPEPVNVALTLRENGQIQFLYGPGNQNLITRAPFGGCVGTAPVVGISRGVNGSVFTHIYGYERVNFKDAPALSFYPPFENATIPVARVESPAPGDKVTGILNLRGTIYDTDTFVTGANVLIDGVYVARATLNVSRPDACTGANTVPGCPNIGFSLNLDLKGAGIRPGSHTLQIRAVNAKGGFKDYPESPISFTMETGDGPLPVAGFDSLTPGAVWKGLVPLRGFAYSKSTRVTAVDLIIDNVAFGRAAYGIANAALCQGDAAGSPNCPGVSWLLPLDTATGNPSLPNGEHSVQLRITEDSGRISFQPETPIKVTVDNPATKPPTGVVTAPTNLERVSGTINISGHAWDPDGRITTAILVVDGASRAVLRYGVARPEVCATLKDVPACPNIGFEGTFDTRTLPNGAHTLGVLLLDTSSLFTLIPSLTANGMNLIVANPQ